MYFRNVLYIGGTLPLCMALCISLRTEVYVAHPELKKLFDTESILIQVLHQYIPDQKHSVAVSKKVLFLLL